MTYQLRITRKVKRDIDRLPGHIRQRARRSIAELTVEPRPATAKPLEAELAGYWRLRLADYRIIYTVHDDRRVVEVIRVSRRTPSTYAAIE